MALTAMAILQPLRLALICAFALVVLTLAPSNASPAAIPLSPSDKELLNRLERYLDNIRSVRARFVQVSSAGGAAEGTFEMQRPGRMRILYDDPVPVEIYADGDWIHYHDKELEQVTSSPISWTPAAPLLNENIRFSGDRYEVIGLNKAVDAIIVTMADRDESAIGSLTLVFTDEPLVLRRWSTTDAQGIVTSVTLMAPDFNAEFSPGTFSFEDPYPSVLSDENR